MKPLAQCTTYGDLCLYKMAHPDRTMDQLQVEWRKLCSHKAEWRKVVNRQPTIDSILNEVFTVVNLDSYRT